MSSIIQQVLQNLPLRKPIDKVISSSRAGTELRAVIQRFRPFVDDVQAAIEDLNERVTDATSTTINMDLASLELPPDIQSEVHLHVQNLTVGSQASALTRPPITDFWDDSNTAVEFFIDTENGLDTNDGRSSSAPLKTWEKARELISAKRITDNYNTYVRVKGTLEAPLNLGGIFGYSDRVSTLLFAPWGGENGWELDAPGLCSAIESANISVDFTQAHILCKRTVLFDVESAVYINQCTFKSAFTSSAKFLEFANGEFFLDSCSFDYSTLNEEGFSPYVNCSRGAVLRISGNNALVNYVPQGVNTLFNLLEGSALDLRPGAVFSGGVAKIAHWGRSILYRPSSHDLSIEFVNNGGEVVVENASDLDGVFYTYHHFNSLTDGDYFLAWTPDRGVLERFDVTAKAGTGTFQLTANGTNTGNSVTATWNNYNSRQTEPIELQANYAYAYGHGVTVSSSTGLTDVVIALRWKINNPRKG